MDTFRKSCMLSGGCFRGVLAFGFSEDAPRAASSLSFSSTRQASGQARLDLVVFGRLAFGCSPGSRARDPARSARGGLPQPSACQRWFS